MSELDKIKIVAELLIYINNWSPKPKGNKRDGLHTFIGAKSGRKRYKNI